MTVDDSGKQRWNEMQETARAKRAADGEAELPLFGGGGGGTSGGMDTVDAKIAAAEARTDTKFAELRAELHRLPGKGTIWGAVGTVVGSLIAILGIVLGVLAFGGSRFDSGMSARGSVEAAMSEQHKRDDAQDRKLDEILRRLPPPAGK